MRRRDVRVSVIALGEDPLAQGVNETNDNPLTCARSAVLLGRRGTVNLWPFANGSAVSERGDAVPREAVLMRRAVYDEFGIASRLPMEMPAAEMSTTTRRTFDLPPLVMLYARRNGRKDPVEGQAIRGTTRRFSDADERWVRQMLREEGSKAGVVVRETQVRGTEGFGGQVRTFEQAGLVVGIHGANLMNAMFARPFSGLVEIFPGGAVLKCYIAGANSGLAYWKHEAEKASEEESHCGPWHRDCVGFFRQRRVKIDGERHRTEIRETVRKGLQHLRDLHARYPGGIPVRYERGEDRFVIEQV